MATDMAANSDSTLTYSQGASVAGLHELGERLDDVRLRRDRVGADDLRAAQRDGLGDGARALHLPKRHQRSFHLVLHVSARRGGRDVAVGDLRREPRADGRRDRRRARRRR